MNLLNAYLWGYENWEAADNSFRKFREFYPNGDIHIQLDNGGDFENYNRVAEKWKASIKKNPFRIGRCGIFGNYSETSNGPENTRDCWPKENTILWCDNIYDTCKNLNSKFLIVLEEDGFIIKPISILTKEFGIAVLEYNTNVMPPVLLDVVNQLSGNVEIPLNIFGNKGYGASGGFIIDCEKWIKSWEKFKPVLELNYDMIMNQTKLIGWSDCIAQLVIMVGGYEVIQNSQMVQTWYHERPDLYPNYTHWKNYEIVDYLKNIEEIKKL